MRTIEQSFTLLTLDLLLKACLSASRFFVLQTRRNATAGKNMDEHISIASQPVFRVCRISSVLTVEVLKEAHPLEADFAF